ncbi:MAG: hypothetical protein QOE90_2836 [Thermoplasmata archaeon]|jgi:DNA-binding transcriptional ArsR family regulator|nr:hypothetical protein [Thermoplasmata archaeon]
MLREEARVTRAPDNDLVLAFETLASPLRVALLHRLASPAFAPDLAREFGITRQALRRHLEAMEAVGLVATRQARRGALPATEYAASPQGLFAFKESVLALALPPVSQRSPATHTVAGGAASPGPSRQGPGLLLAHGDAPGRWFALARGKSWILGRDPRGDVPLAYDPFASARHAMVSREPTGWTLTDLHSTNGTFLDFDALAPGETRPLRNGALVTVGRTRLLFRDGA